MGSYPICFGAKSSILPLASCPLPDRSCPVLIQAVSDIGHFDDATANYFTDNQHVVSLVWIWRMLTHQPRTRMLINYLKIAWRNLLNHKLFTFINVFGLASGLVVCLLAITQIKGAFDYDDFHPDAHRTYRIITDANLTLQRTGEVLAIASTPLPLGEALAREYDFIDQHVRVYRNPGQTISTGQKTLPARGVYVDPDFFTLFGFRLALGRPAIAPQTAVLSRKMAERFFGQANPIGQTLWQKQGGSFTITGVFETPAHPTHLQFDWVASMATVPLLETNQTLPAESENWRNYWTAYTYVSLRAGTPAKTLTKALSAITAQVHKTSTATVTERYTFRVQPLSALSPAREALVNSTDEPRLSGLLLFGALAVVILLLAGINYVSLTLARSLDRTREVGIRKVVGALRWQVIGQFLIESVLVSLLALGLAAAMWQGVQQLPSVQRYIVGQTQQDALLWGLFVGFTLLVGLVAGLIPARILSAYLPVQVLRGAISHRATSRINWRKILIIGQFSISLIFMVFVTVMYRQSVYMATASYGFQREHILNVPLAGQSYGRLADAFRQQSGVELVSAASVRMGLDFGDSQSLRKRRGGDSTNAQLIAADAQFVATMNLTVVAGKNLPPSVGDSAGRFVLLNQQAVGKLNLGTPAQAVGKTIWLNDSTDVQISGVLKDFHFLNLKHAITPLVIRYQPDRFAFAQLRIKDSSPATVATLSQVWKGLKADAPFTYSWYDQELYDHHLHRDNNLFLALLTAMTLSIACLGLLGMVSYSTQTRTKEIGIRKVMGANVSQVLVLLSADFVRMLAIAGLVGLPIGYWAGQLFLDEYAYKTAVTVGLLGFAFGTLLLLGGMMIGLQTYRAALMNPVKSLRNE